MGDRSCHMKCHVGDGSCHHILLYRGQELPQPICSSIRETGVTRMKLHFCRSGIFLGVKFQKYRQDGLPARVAWMEKFSFFYITKTFTMVILRKFSSKNKKKIWKKRKKLPPKWAQLCLIEQWKNQLFEFLFLALKKFKNTLPPCRRLITKL